MNITIPLASELTEKRKAKERAKQEALEQIAEKFINGPLSTAILNASGKSVNEKLPPLGEYDSEEFCHLCSEILERLGYDAGQSHDGGGMYATLCVRWP
jgi:hypothetical protein